MLESIIDIVRRAGELVRSANDVTAATHEKNGPADLVTEYDLAVQRFLAAGAAGLCCRRRLSSGRRGSTMP